MAEISVVFGYRNRDIARVKRCMDSLKNQTFSDFEVIFIDYGSDESFVRQVHPLIDRYAFAHYYYLYTAGYPWNRSHALNVGVRMSHSPYIFFGDVDLIYSNEVMEQLYIKRREDIEIYCPVYFLPPKFNRWDQLSSHQKKDKYPNFSDAGGIHFFSRHVLEEIHGYDEYYCFWGVEDRDLNCRVQLMGITSVELDRERYPILHQWHPSVSNRKRGVYTEKRWDTINIYCSLNRDRPIRNENGWGKYIRLEDRPIFTAEVAETLIYSSYGRSYQKAQEIDRIVKKLNALNGNECLQIVLRKRTMGVLSFSLVRYVNLLIRICRLRLGIDYIENVEKEKYFYSADIFYVVWQLIRTQGVIRDYSMVEENDSITIRLMRGISLSQRIISQ